MAVPDLSILGRNNGGTWGMSSALRLPSGARAAAQFDRMRREDPIVGAVLYAIDSIVQGVQWTAEAAPDAPDAARADAERVFLQQCMEDMSHTMQAMTLDAVTMFPHGWAMLEVVYKYRRGPTATNPAHRSAYADGRVGWRKMPLRPQASLDKWEYDDDEGVRGMWQRTKNGSVMIPIERALLFTLGGPGNGPEGRSILANAYRSWYFAWKLEEFEAIGVERNFGGIPDMQVPVEYLSADATPAQKAALHHIERQMADLRSNQLQYLIRPAEKEALTVDEGDDKERVVDASTGFQFKLLTGDGNGNAQAADRAIRRHTQRMAQALLSEFLLLGMEKGGSYAMHEDKTDLMVKAISGGLDVIEATLNRHAVRRLMLLNGVPVEYHPRIKHGNITVRDVSALAAALDKLTRAGILTADDPLETYVRESYDLPAHDPTTARKAPTPTPGAQPGEDDAQAGRPPQQQGRQQDTNDDTGGPA